MKRQLFLISCAAALALWGGARTARADDRWLSPEVEVHPLGPGGNCMIIHTQPPARRSDQSFPKLFYLNRCVGGCEVRDPGTWQTSSIDDVSGICDPLRLDTCYLSEFDQGDEMWEAMVDCVKEVLRPFDIEVVTEDPGDVPHQEVMVAGTPDELGIPSNDTLGISNFGCEPIENAISFVFANQPILEGDLTYLCHVAVHEPGHAYGLYHSAPCEDPMTYLTGCGTKYFRDWDMRCADLIDDVWTEIPSCLCDRDTQNTHQHLLDIFGPGVGARPPEVWIAYPQEGDELRTGDVVHALATDDRGISRVELYLNTWKWYELGGHEWRDRDQPYVLRIPNELPDGIVDVEVRAYNDLGLTASSGFISLRKGEPCTSAATCLAGQICGDGRCFWPPPTQKAGETCERAQDCLEGGCRSHDGEMRCAPFCEPEAEQSCAEGFACVSTETAAFCWPEGGGCCSAAGRNSRPPWLEFALALGVLLLVSRSRTRT